jgi:hypothetical protein
VALTKQDADRLEAQAAQSDRVYRLTKGWRVTCVVLGVLCCALIVLIPFGILMFILAAKARIAIADEGMVIRWMGTRAIAWEDFQDFRQMPLSIAGGVPGGGLLVGMAVGAAKGVAAASIRGPVGYLQAGRKTWGNIAVHWHERSGEIVALMEERTGKIIIPRKAAP